MLLGGTVVKNPCMVLLIRLHQVDGDREIMDSSDAPKLPLVVHIAGEIGYSSAGPDVTDYFIHFFQRD